MKPDDLLDEARARYDKDEVPWWMLVILAPVIVMLIGAGVGVLGWCFLVGWQAVASHLPAVLP